MSNVNSFTNPIETLFYCEIIPIYGQGMKPKSIHISIKKLEDTLGDVGIEDVARILKGIQDSIYHLGEYKFSKGYRVVGRRNRNIEKRTKLHFKMIKMGSIVAEIEGDPQEALFGQSLVEDAIDTFGTLCTTLNDKDIEKMEKEVNQEIENPYHRARIIGDIADFWPGQDNQYRLELETVKFKKRLLDEKKRPPIQSLRRIESKMREKEVFGFLKKLESGLKKEIEIIGPYGKIKCKFKDKDKEKIRMFWDSVVAVEGEMKVDELGNITGITNISNIKPLKEISLDRILIDKGELKLKKPIQIEIFFQENNWIMEHPILNIVAYNEKYDDTLTDFQEDFYALYEHYYLKPPKKLGKNAQKIQKFFQQILSKRGR